MVVSRVFSVPAQLGQRAGMVVGRSLNVSSPRADTCPAIPVAAAQLNHRCMWHSVDIPTGSRFCTSTIRQNWIRLLCGVTEQSPPCPGGQYGRDER
jgi:hypothetical protein